MLAHLSALAGLVIPLIGNVLGPLLSRSRALISRLGSRTPGKRSTSHLVTLAALLCTLLMLVFVGFLLGSALFIACWSMTLIAAIRRARARRIAIRFRCGW